MTLSDIYTILSSMNVEVAYDHFTTKKTPPFILYREESPESFFADDYTYYKDLDIIVDLVTENKDPDLEASLEALFDLNKLPYEKDCDFIEGEQIYQTRYYIGG